MDTCLLFSFYAHAKLLDYSFFDIGKSWNYYDQKASTEIFKEQYQKAFKPALTTIFAFVKEQGHVNLAFTGYFLEQWQKTDPECLQLLREQVEEGTIELMGTTYHHSIASLFSPDLFQLEATQQAKLVKKLFGVSPKTFFNTEGIFYNDLGDLLVKQGYTAVVTEALPWYLNNHSPHQLFLSATKGLSILLNADFAHGEKSEVRVKHFDVPRGSLQVEKILKDHSVKNSLISTHEALLKYKAVHGYNVPMPIGHNSERHFSYFSENAMQKEAIAKLKQLVNTAKEKNPELLFEIAAFARLEFFMTMNYKGLSSLSGQPYDFYIAFMNILSDFEIKHF